MLGRVTACQAMAVIMKARNQGLNPQKQLACAFETHLVRDERPFVVVQAQLVHCDRAPPALGRLQSARTELRNPADIEVVELLSEFWSNDSEPLAQRFVGYIASCWRSRYPLRPRAATPTQFEPLTTTRIASSATIRLRNQHTVPVNMTPQHGLLCHSRCEQHAGHRRHCTQC